jgi:YD repeat-containing protein
LLTQLSSGGTDYDYRYDGWGRKTEIRIANRPHVEFEYGTESNGNEIVKATYANGESYETVTDRYGKLLKVDRITNNARMPYISYVYDAKERVTAIADHLAGKITEYEYNEDGSLRSEKDGDVESVTDRNIDGATEKIRFVITDVGEQTYRNVYDNDGKLSEILLPNSESERKNTTASVASPASNIRGITNVSYTIRTATTQRTSSHPYTKTTTVRSTSTTRTAT